MKNSLLIIIPVLIAIGALYLTNISQSEKSSSFTTDKDFLRKEFQTATPKPEWWDSVNIGNISISNYDELIAYWQSEKRCCSKEEIQYTNKQFFKAAYLEVLEHIDDPDIVVNSINMMNLSYLDYPDFAPMQLYALKNYPDYNKPLHACANCKEGDVVASLLEEAGNSMRKADRHEEHIELVKEFLEKRRKEMSDYYQARVYLSLAYTYNDKGDKNDAIRTLNSLLETFKDSPPSGSLKNTMNSASRLLAQLTEDD